ELIRDGHVVIDMAEFGAGADLPTTRTVTAHRVLVAHHPGHLVEAVTVLLDVEVAGQPGEIEPIADLPLHIAPAGLAGAVPERAGVVSGLQGDDVAHGAVVHALNRLAHAGMLAPAEAAGD